MKIPEIKIVLSPETTEAQQAVGFRWNDEAGTRHKLGGSPDWIQFDETPSSVDCGEEMTLYGQLDSIGDDFCLGDCGIIYVFVCFDCLTTRGLLQSY